VLVYRVVSRVEGKVLLLSLVATTIVALLVSRLLRKLTRLQEACMHNLVVDLPVFGENIGKFVLGLLNLCQNTVQFVCILEIKFELEFTVSAHGHGVHGASLGLLVVEVGISPELHALVAIVAAELVDREKSVTPNPTAVLAVAKGVVVFEHVVASRVALLIFKHMGKAHKLEGREVELLVPVLLVAGLVETIFRLIV